MSGSVSVSLPVALAKLVNRTGADLDVQVQEALALHLFQQGAISSRTAATLLGISSDAFLELLAARNIP